MKLIIQERFSFWYTIYEIIIIIFYVWKYCF